MAEPATPLNRHDDKPVPQPVMDVTPPKPVEQSKAPTHEEPNTAQAPAPADEEPVYAPVTHAAPAKPPKQHNSSVALAVIATIILVLGLGALFVYAYLRTNHLSIL